MPTSNRRIRRRDFLTQAAAGAAGLTLASRFTSAATTAPSEKPPNIVVIMSDEHNPHVTGCYGNTIARTPHMDSLAEKGITFENHYCNSPLCSPSRSSITSGKYVSRVGMWNNGCELPSADIASIPRVMNAAGYESFLCGKQHYDYSRRYGFTEVGGNFNNTFKDGRGGRRPATATEQKGDISERFAEFHAGDRSSTMRHDQRVTSGALEFLNKRTGNEKPFFLFVGYLAPHFPIVAPKEYHEHFKGKIDLPQIPTGFLDRLPLNYKLLRAGFKEIGVPDDTVRLGRELYYGLTEWIDNEIGKVLAALYAKPKVANNTIIIYTSDHGENMGEHGMWWKNCMFDQAAKVPLIVSWPKRFAGGQRRGKVSAHLDLVKTIADLGGGKTPDDWNGDSMLPVMDDGKATWKDQAVSEYYAHNIASGFVMLRQDNWKYTYHTTIDKDHPAERQLFDLTTDPGEFTNLASKPEHAQRITQMHSDLAKEVGGDPDETEQRCRHELAKGYNRTDKKPAGSEKGGD
jgi:choline-sulfatase